MQRAPIGALCILSCRGSMVCFYSAPLAWNPTAVDRGVQSLAMSYTQRLAEAELVPSVGSVGDSYDNPVLS